MTSDSEKAEAVEQLLETPDLASALESEQFKKFLDQVPIAIAVSDLSVKERVIYANPEFEKLSGLEAARLARENWAALSGTGLDQNEARPLAEALIEETDFVGTFRLERGEGEPAIVDVYANIIEDDNGKICFRLVALVDVSIHGETEDLLSVEDRNTEKDILLRELQHRVNNLQMITALIRMEIRHAAEPDQKRFERLAGRVHALAILYQTLSTDELEGRNRSRSISQPDRVSGHEFSRSRGHTPQHEGRHLSSVDQRRYADRACGQRAADKCAQTCLPGS